MARSIALLLLAALIGGPPQPRLGATVRAFGEALTKRDYKAMAALVYGGDTSFDYSRLTEDGGDLGKRYTKFAIKILEEKIAGDTAVVQCRYSYSLPGGFGIPGDEPLSLKLERGSWKIVSTQCRSGNFLEDTAAFFADPEAALQEHDAKYGPTRNSSPETLKLGKERATFLDAVWTIGERHGDSWPAYSGYQDGMGGPYTKMFWPAGRADEVVFYLYSGKPREAYATCWRRVSGKPTRMWQVKMPATGKGEKLDVGTLARRLGEVPISMPKDMEATLAKVRPYATYQISLFDYECGIVLEDGTQKKNEAWGVFFLADQPLEQASTRGFFITPDELAAMKN
jgi:hypothetical protein